jgi:hypothetical protein
MLCYYGECHYAECRILFTIMLNVEILGVVMQSVVAPRQTHKLTTMISPIEKFYRQCLSRLYFVVRVFALGLSAVVYFLPL